MRLLLQLVLSVFWTAFAMAQTTGDTTQDANTNHP